jgi:ribokinase
MVDVLVVGAINWDINLFVKAFPRPGEEMVVEKITRVPGGKAGNVAVAAARLLGPDRVAIVSSLGDDQIAKQQVEIFRSEGVVTDGILHRTGIESGQAYIVIDSSGENIIHTYFGANATTSGTDFQYPRLARLVESAKITTVMDPPADATDKITRIAAASKRVVAWDPGVRAKLGPDTLRAILQRVSYLVVNEVETEYLTGTTDPDVASEQLLRENPGLHVVLKRGKEGCVLQTTSGARKFSSVDLEGLEMKVVNTVGCGDAFLGAFVAAKAEGKPDDEAIQWANAAGAFKATKMETRGSPRRKELDEFLAAINNLR